MTFVVDASVAFMWFVPEAHSRNATLLVSEGYDLVAPELIGAEVGNALLKAFRRGDITATYVRESLKALLDELVQRRESAMLLDRALEITRRHGGSVYDALYVALAASISAPLITADQRMAEIAKAVRVRVFTIDKPLPPP